MDIFKAFEDASANLSNIAILLAQYKADLIHAGFTEEQAFALVLDQQYIIFNMPIGRNGQ